MTATIKTITAVDTTAETLTATAHGLNTGDRFRLRNIGGALPAATPALAGATTYFAIRVDNDKIKVTPTSADALAGTNIVNLTGSGSGTNQIEYGLPYCERRVAAAGSQVFSVDDNEAWASLAALHALLTGQSQSLWTVTPAARWRLVGPTKGAVETSVTFSAGATVTASADAGLLVGTQLVGLKPGDKIYGMRCRLLGSVATGTTTVTLQRHTDGSLAAPQTLSIVDPPNSWASYSLTFASPETIADDLSYSIGVTFAKTGRAIQSIALLVGEPAL